jgi:hypothetical protein
MGQVKTQRRQSETASLVADEGPLVREKVH